MNGNGFFHSINFIVPNRYFPCRNFEMHPRIYHRFRYDIHELYLHTKVSRDSHLIFSSYTYVYWKKCSTQDYRIWIRSDIRGSCSSFYWYDLFTWIALDSPEFILENLNTLNIRFFYRNPTWMSRIVHGRGFARYRGNITYKNNFHNGASTILNNNRIEKIKYLQRYIIRVYTEVDIYIIFNLRLIFI